MLYSLLLRSLQILLIGAALGGPPATAAEPKGAVGSPQIAIVDVQKILRESAASRSLRPQLIKLKEDYQARFKKTEEDLRAQNQDLNRQRAILSPEAYEAQRTAFRKRASVVQREVQAAQRQLDGALANAMGRVHDTFVRITEKYAREKGIRLILPRSGVIMMDTRYDITAAILKELNKQLPTLKIQLPPAGGTGADGKDGKK